MSPYIAILGVLVVSAALLGVMVLASVFIGPARFNKTKYSVYECGIDPTPAAVGGGRFPVKYYVTAMLFIIFDIETVFLYPWAASFDQLGIMALVEMILFVITVMIAYVYVFRRGGLDWE